MTINTEQNPGPEAHYDPKLEAELTERFSAERIGALCNEFLEIGTGINLKEQLNGRPFVVSYIDGESPYSDLPRQVETTVFSTYFKMPLSEVYKKYSEKDDPQSTFVCVIDVTDPDRPKPVGALRMVEYKRENGHKDLRDLVIDEEWDPETLEGNPWLEEIKTQYFASNEKYDPQTAISRLLAATGENIDLNDTIDVTSHAVIEEARGNAASIDSPTMLFFHACLDEALRKGAKNLVAIFDEKPFENIQQFGEPFSTYEGLGRHPYDGPGNTVPAYCVLEKGMKKIDDFDIGTGDVFIRGKGLEATALMPKEQPERRIF